MKLFKFFKKNKTHNKALSKYEMHRQIFDIGIHSYLSYDACVVAPDVTKIGKYTTIARGTFIGTGQHPYDRLTIHPLTYCEQNPELYGDIVTPKECIIPALTHKPVNIGNDVWIGVNAIVQDGVTIGDGAIIGSGAVVTKDIPPYAIAVGVPAKVIKYRFSQEIITKLLELKWWDYPKDFIVRLPFDNIEKCIELLEANKHLKDSLCEK